MRLNGLHHGMVCISLSLLLWGVTWSTVAQQELTDPTRPAKVAANADQPAGNVDDDGFPAIAISAIFHSKSGKRVVIDGESLTEGDIYKGLDVVEITLNSVVMANQQKQKTYYFTNQNVANNVSTDF